MVKTPREIKAYLEAIRYGLVSECECAETGHAAECLQGMRQMIEVENALAWVLGQASQSYLNHVAGYMELIRQRRIMDNYRRN